MAVSEIESIRRRVRGCQRCPMHISCRGGIPGSGPAGADVMVVGQAPGKEEDEYGECFIGQAGAFLQAVLKRWGFGLNRVYYTNIGKCFPGRGKDGDKLPTDAAMRNCPNWLRLEYEAVRPKIILAIGGFSMKFFGIKGGIRVNSGKVFDTPEWGPVMPMIHPASLMRNPGDAPIVATQPAALIPVLEGGLTPPAFVDFDAE